jgi:hypothetical protein
LRAGIVTKGRAQFQDALRKRTIRDRPIPPQILEQFLLRDNAVAALEKVNQEGEGLGTRLRHSSGTSNRSGLEIDFNVINPKDLRFSRVH